MCACVPVPVMHLHLPSGILICYEINKDFYFKKMFRKKIDETLKESSSAMTRCEILCFISFCRFYPKFPNKSDKFIYLLTIYKNPFCIFNLSWFCFFSSFFFSFPIRNIEMSENTRSSIAWCWQLCRHRNVFRCLYFFYWKKWKTTKLIFFQAKI